MWCSDSCCKGGSKDWAGLERLQQWLQPFREDGDTRQLEQSTEEVAQLQELHLPGRRLSALPPELGLLSELRDLVLARNELSSVPPELARLAALRSLDMSSNQLAAVPSEWGHLAKLERLILKDNRLCFVPRELGRLAALQKLDLSKNQLSVIPPEVGLLTSLQRLHLQENKLLTVPAELGRLCALRELDLSHNQLQRVPLELRQLAAKDVLKLAHNLLCETTELQGLRKSAKQECAMEELPLDVALQKLHTWLKPHIGKKSREEMLEIEALHFHSVQILRLPQEVGRLSKLRILDCEDNLLSMLPHQVGQLESLEWLQIRKNCLTTVPSELGELASLRRLDLQENRLQAVPKEVGQLQSLYWLNLERNDLERVPKELGQLGSLRYLNMGHNQLSELPEELNDLMHLHHFQIQCNQISGPFVLEPLFKRLASDVEAIIHVGGNCFNPIDFKDEAWTTGDLHDPITTEYGASSICVASFCGSEFLDWQLLLIRCRLQRRPVWSQLCVFLPDYATVSKWKKAASDRHASGLGSRACQSFGRYFEAADAFTEGRASEAHEKFGCCWFQTWKRNVNTAVKKGHRRFLVFTKSDRTVGVCQAVEWLYLLRVRQRFPDLELECVTVLDAAQVMQFGPYPSGHHLRTFTAFQTPTGLPASLPASLSLALGGPVTDFQC